MFAMGLFFAIFGAIFVIIGIAVSFVFVAVHEMMGAIMFCAIFGGVGLVFVTIGLVMIFNKRKIIKNGRRIEGEIIAYEDDHTLTINGYPALDIIIKCYIDGSEKVIRMHTGTSREEKYPIGAFVTICEYQGKTALLPNSVRG